MTPLVQSQLRDSIPGWGHARPDATPAPSRREGGQEGEGTVRALQKRSKLFGLVGATGLHATDWNSLDSAQALLLCKSRRLGGGTRTRRNLTRPARGACERCRLHGELYPRQRHEGPYRAVALKF